MRFIQALGSFLLTLSLVACNNSGESSEASAPSLVSANSTADIGSAAQDEIEVAPNADDLSAAPSSNLMPQENDCRSTQSAEKPTSKALSGASPTLLDGVNGYVLQHVVATQQPFNWNEADESVLCRAFMIVGGEVTLGIEPDENGKYRSQDFVWGDVDSRIGDSYHVLSENLSLGTFRIKFDRCDDLLLVKNSESISFIDLPGASNINEYLSAIENEEGVTVNTSVLSLSDDGVCLNDEEGSNDEGDQSTDVDGEQPISNQAIELSPGLYDAENVTASYMDYVRQFDEESSTRMQHHNMDALYNDYDAYGQGIGVAVLDNGIHEKDIEFLSSGGDFKAIGLYDPKFRTGGYDGISPQAYDSGGMSKNVEFLYDHGTVQSKRVFALAPQSKRMSVRASSFIVLTLPSQYKGVADSITAMATNPDVRIISMSLASLVYNHEIKRAIDYFVSKGKIFVTVAGTSIPGIKEFYGVVFPANLPTTISMTGIKDTDFTDGEFELGFQSHGGKENDFVLDYAESSSPSASTMSGMIASLWSINPMLNSEEIMTILVQSSNYYLSRGEKHAVFGWGKVDMGLAASKAFESL